MPTRTRPVAVWTPAYVANVVAATVSRAADHGLRQAIREVARTHRLSPATIEEWVSRARTVQTAPVPAGLLVCQACDQPMILIQLPAGTPLYLCAPACARVPVPAEAIRDAVAAAVLHRTPHLVPTGKTARAAAYAPGAIHRISVGATPTDLRITWRTVPRQLTGPLMAMAQRLHHARLYVDTGDRIRAINVLRTGLLHINPTHDTPALDTATAQAAAYLAELTLVTDPPAALPWATWAHRSLRHLLGAASVQARAALRILAAVHRRTGDLTAATNAYSDLIRHHTEAEGPTALPTLATQAALAVVLHDAGHCEDAQHLLACTITTHRRVYGQHPGGARMTDALHHMRATCIDKRHDHQLRDAHVTTRGHSGAASDPVIVTKLTVDC